jgi:hypothetical protein
MRLSLSGKLNELHLKINHLKTSNLILRLNNYLPTQIYYLDETIFYEIFTYLFGLNYHL